MAEDGSDSWLQLCCLCNRTTLSMSIYGKTKAWVRITTWKYTASANRNKMNMPAHPRRSDARWSPSMRQGGHYGLAKKLAVWVHALVAAT